MGLPPIEEWRAEAEKPGGGQFVTVVQDYYLHEKKNATPRKILPLVELLDRIAHATRKSYQTPMFPTGTKVQLDGWDKRSVQYRVRLANAIKEDPDEGSGIAIHVTGPLIMGIWPSKEKQSIPDMITPIQAADMAKATKASMDEAWKLFVEDMTRAIKEAEAVYDTAKESSKAVSNTTKLVNWMLDPEHRVRLLIIPATLAAITGTAIAIRKATT